MIRFVESIPIFLWQPRHQTFTMRTIVRALPSSQPLVVASLLLWVNNHALSFNPSYGCSYVRGHRRLGARCLRHPFIEGAACNNSPFHLQDCFRCGPQATNYLSRSNARNAGSTCYNKMSPFMRLSASSLSSPDEESSSPMPSASTPQSDPKSQLSLLYSAGRVMFGITGLVLLLMPDRTMTTLLAAKWGGAAGFGIAAGLCDILKGANDHDRLSSDTYKRLSLGLLGFHLVGLTAIPGEAAFLPEALPAMVLTAAMTCLRVFGCVLAFRGWKRGCDPKGSWTIQSGARELAKGLKETLLGLKVQSKKKALTYRNCFLLVCFGIFSSFMEGLFNIEVRQQVRFVPAEPNALPVRCLGSCTHVIVSFVSDSFAPGLRSACSGQR
jgi:hypothetical protein